MNPSRLCGVFLILTRRLYVHKDAKLFASYRKPRVTLSMLFVAVIAFISAVQQTGSANPVAAPRQVYMSVFVYVCVCVYECIYSTNMYTVTATLCAVVRL